MDKRVFVTVGTTKFNDLILEITKKDALETLYSKGYRYLTLQIGEGLHIPEEGEFYGVTVEVFQYKASLQEDFKKADLIISHAGAASCMEALLSKKRLITVVNNSLMDNHQIELAEALAEEEYAKWCYPDDIVVTIKDFADAHFREYLPSDTGKVVDYVDSMFILSDN